MARKNDGFLFSKLIDLLLPTDCPCASKFGARLERRRLAYAIWEPAYMTFFGSSVEDGHTRCLHWALPVISVASKERRRALPPVMIYQAWRPNASSCISEQKVGSGLSHHLLNQNFFHA